MDNQQAQSSILPREMHGVMYVTGLRGVGKTFLAAQADVPENIVFLDFEEKGSGVHAMLKFGLYRSLTSEAAAKFGPTYKPSHLYEIIKGAFNGLEQGRFTVAVIDNIQPFEEALLAEVKRDPKSYGIDPGKANSGAFGGAWPGVNNLVSGFVNQLYSKGVQLVIAIAHVKAVWAAGGQVPNKWKPKGVERWQELSILSLVLVPGQFAPIPAALVQKEQLGLIKFNAEIGEHVVLRRLPLRLPKATFAEIRRYLREPADLTHAAPGEVPTEAEASPFSEKLSREQLEFMRLAAKIEAHEAETESGLKAATVGSNGGDPRTLVELLSACARVGVNAESLCKTLGVPGVAEIKDFSVAWKAVNNGSNSEARGNNG